MLTTVEAEIGTNGIVRLLEPVKVSRRSRAIVTIFDAGNGPDPVKIGPDERRQALQNLMKHAGAVESGDPAGGDNDRIDADLASGSGEGL